MRSSRQRRQLQRAVLRRPRSSPPETRAAFDSSSATAPGCDIAVRGRFRGTLALYCRRQERQMPREVAREALARPLHTAFRSGKDILFGQAVATHRRRTPGSVALCADRRRVGADSVPGRRCGVVVMVLIAGGVGAFAWARRRGPRPPTSTASALVSQSAAHRAPQPWPRRRSLSCSRLLPSSSRSQSSRQHPQRATSDAVAKAAVPFPDAPAVKSVSLGQLKPKHKYVAITLDDGYGFQPEMLELLQKYDARCTTFVLGSWAADEQVDSEEARCRRL